MAEVVHSLTSADGRLRIEVVRRPTGGYQLACSRHHQEHVPEYGFVWAGWVSVAGRVTLTDTPERGAALAAEEMALWERQDAEQGAAVDPPRAAAAGELCRSATEGFGAWNGCSGRPA